MRMINNTFRVGLVLLVCICLTSMTGCGGGHASKEREIHNIVAELGGRIETNSEGLATFINLSDTNADNDTLDVLAQLTSLEKLWLAETNVTDDGMAALAELTQLQVLVLSDTYVSNVGLEQLANLTSLRELYLHRSRVNQNGVEKIQEKLPNLTIIY